MNLFKAGQHNISYINSNFQEHFGSMPVKSSSPKLQFRKLEKSMNNKEILAEFKPKESTLGDFLYALNNPKKVDMSENGYANIFYIRDTENTLWAAYAYWDADDGWYVFADSVERPSGWYDGCQVFSRKFGVLGSLESWNLDGEIIEIKGKKYKLVLTPR